MLMMITIRLLSATQRHQQQVVVAAFQQTPPIAVHWNRHNNQNSLISRRYLHHHQHFPQSRSIRTSNSMNYNVRQNHHQTHHRDDNRWSFLSSSQQQSQIIRLDALAAGSSTKLFSSSLSATNNDDDSPTTTTITTTQYTITEPGVDHDVLYKTVMRHCETLDLYTSKRPIAIHTQDAFDLLEQQLDRSKNSSNNGNQERKPIILDSGCGTGRSTVLLGKMFPNHIIVGVDKSLVRLNRNAVYRYQKSQQQQQSKQSLQGSQDEEDDDEGFEDLEEGEDKKVTLQQPASNVFLVRAELADFWRLWIASDVIQNQYQLDYHYILYPNPYPKQKRFQNRWYGHPSFPLLCRLAASGGDHHELIVRSNWKEYLEDFNKSMEWVLQNRIERPRRNGGEVERDQNKSDATDTDETSMMASDDDDKFGMVTLLEPINALTNFEQKYHKAGEATYELKLKIPNIVM